MESSKMAREIINKLYEYYKANQKELVKQYENKHIVIVDEAIINHFDTLEDAYAYCVKRFESGTFLIHLVLKEEDEPIYHFTSRVYFST